MRRAADNRLPEGRIILDKIVPARAPWSARLTKGQMLRLIDLEGGQAIDFLCFNAENPAERYDATNTIKIEREIYIGEGTVLRSSLARPLMTVIADSCGRHDTIFGCCSHENNVARYGRTNSETCRNNFEQELAKHAIGREHIVPNVNFFMHVPIGPQGEANIAQPLSKPGDYVELRAETDVLVVLSNCPQELNAATGPNGPSPVRAIVWSPG